MPIIRKTLAFRDLLNWSTAECCVVKGITELSFMKPVVIGRDLSEAQLSAGDHTICPQSDLEKIGRAPPEIVNKGNPRYTIFRTCLPSSKNSDSANSSTYMMIYTLKKELMLNISSSLSFLRTVDIYNFCENYLLIVILIFRRQTWNADVKLNWHLTVCRSCSKPVDPFTLQQWKIMRFS